MSGESIASRALCSPSIRSFQAARSAAALGSVDTCVLSFGVGLRPVEPLEKIAEPAMDLVWVKAELPEAVAVSRLMGLAMGSTA